MASEGSAGAPQPAQMNWARVALDAFNAEHGSSFTIEPSNVYDQTAPRRRRGETPGRRSGRRRSRRTRLVVGHRDRRTDLRCCRPRLRLAVGDGRLADRRTSQALLPGRGEQQQASRRQSFDWSRRRCIRRPSSSSTTARSTRPTSRKIIVEQPLEGPHQARPGLGRRRAAGLRRRRRQDRAVDERGRHAIRQSR